MLGARVRELTLPPTAHHLVFLTMSLIAPNNKKGGFKGGARRGENNKLYAYPLPLLFAPPEGTSRLSPHRVLGLFGVSGAKLENPHCTGILDMPTRSIWITDRKDAMILWRRGFFGKGDLSRSEPSWHTRQMHARAAAGKRTYVAFSVSTS